MAVMRLVSRIVLFPVWIVFKFLLMWIYVFSFFGLTVAGFSIFVMAIGILLFVAQHQWLLLASVLTGGFVVFLAVMCGGVVLTVIGKVDDKLSDIVFG